MNTRLDLIRAVVLTSVPPGPLQTALLAQIEAARAQANAQINAAIAFCP
jgi:hypothetical protein